MYHKINNKTSNSSTITNMILSIEPTFVFTASDLFPEQPVVEGTCHTCSFRFPLALKMEIPTLI